MPLLLWIVVIYLAAGVVTLITAYGLSQLTAGLSAWPKQSCLMEIWLAVKMVFMWPLLAAGFILAATFFISFYSFLGRLSRENATSQIQLWQDEQTSQPQPTSRAVLIAFTGLNLLIAPLSVWLYWVAPPTKWPEWINWIQPWLCYMAVGLGFCSVWKLIVTPGSVRGVVNQKQALAAVDVGLGIVALLCVPPLLIMLVCKGFGIL